MAQADLFKRYLWLFDLIYRNDGITRDEINRHWCSSRLNDDKEAEISERTFHRHKIAIEHLFDVRIVCDRHGDKSYHVEDRENIKQDGLKEWLLNSVAVVNIIDGTHDLKDRIILEPIPSGQQYLTPIIEAMRAGDVINLSYRSFHMDAPKPHEIEPYCLKIYKQRWYLLGRRVETDTMRTFALDRIKSIELTGNKFSLPKSFDAEKYFENSIGILVEEKCKAQTIIIKACNGKQDYLRSLPLHPSQVEIENDVNETKFSLFVQPNSDLVHELLRFGEDVSVISPMWLREKLRVIVRKMSTNYSEE